MSGLRPPFDLAQIELSGTSDALIHFPDRYRDGVGAPARFEGSQLSLVRVTPAAGHSDFALRWPADGCTNTVDLLPADAATLGVSRLLEISLLPFALAEVLRSMRGGVPTFYFGYAASPYPADDTLVRTSDAPIMLATALFGVIFQDRATLAPQGWFDRIDEALQATRAADAALWQTWSQRYAAQPVLRILNPQGRPLVGQSLTLTISDSSGTVLSTQTRSSDNKGDIAGLAFPTAGQHGELSWQPNPVPAETPLPVMALLETPAETVPGQNLLTLQPGFAGGHLQLLDLANWYARGLHDDPWGPAPGARYRLNSMMQPIVDGIPAFSAILEDINRAKGAGGDALFAGWAFTDFAMRPGDETTSLFRIGSDVAAAGGDVRVLVAQFLQASDASLNTLSREIGLVYLILLGVGNPAALITTAASSYTSPLGLAAFAVLAGAAMALYLSKLENGEAVGETLRKVTEQTDPDFFTKLSTLKGPRFDVRRSPHPVTIGDNPVSASIPLPDGRTLGDLQDRWGVFHQKIQVVRHADSMASSDQDRHVAYVGGIDINENRLDTPGHQGAAFRKPDSVADPTASPFHDVHSRITGPAASDVFAVFAGRYVRDTEGDSTAPPPPAVPTPSALNGTGRDVIQVAQTSFQPKPGSGSVGFDWAPQGNATTYGTIVSAIKAAREFIYIEEQYMVPDKGYIQALVDAAANCQRLVILLPSFLEIFFGDRRRGEMFDEMAAVWGDRMLIGTPMRRPVLAPTGRVASVGRFALVADIDPLASTLFVEPPTRVPKGAFFMWIGGELMYATDSTAVNGPGGKPAMQLTVLRGGLGTAQRWCPNPRAHKAGEPVTLAQPGPIFVHSKIMMVDDLFVAIGSTNVNRRGFFHDGEIHAFAIPQDLKAASDNPARDLRTRLWAEQLGLAPAMGAALLADPIAGFELFRRSHYHGNRFVPLSELKVPTPTLASLPELFEIIPAWARQLLQFTVQNVLELKSDDIFNTLSDPTTGIDPAPEPGPGSN